MVETPFSTCTVEQNTEKNLECIAESGTLLCYNQLRIRDMFNYAIKHNNLGPWLKFRYSVMRKYAKGEFDSWKKETKLLTISLFGRE